MDALPHRDQKAVQRPVNFRGGGVVQHVLSLRRDAAEHARKFVEALFRHKDALTHDAPNRPSALQVLVRQSLDFLAGIFSGILQAASQFRLPQIRRNAAGIEVVKFQAQIFRGVNDVGAFYRVRHRLV